MNHNTGPWYFAVSCFFTCTQEHFLRRIVEDTSTNWFAGIIPLLLGQDPCPSCCIYLFERTLTDSLEPDPLVPLLVDDCREKDNYKSTNMQTPVSPTLDRYRQELVLSYLSDDPLQRKAEVGQATRIILFPDHSAVLLCSITVRQCFNLNHFVYVNRLNYT